MCIPEKNIENDLLPKSFLSFYNQQLWIELFTTLSLFSKVINTKILDLHFGLLFEYIGRFQRPAFLEKDRTFVKIPTVYLVTNYVLF